MKNNNVKNEITYSLRKALIKSRENKDKETEDFMRYTLYKINKIKYPSCSRLLSVLINATIYYPKTINEEEASSIAKRLKNLMVYTYYESIVDKVNNKYYVCPEWSIKDE